MWQIGLKLCIWKVNLKYIWAMKICGYCCYSHSFAYGVIKVLPHSFLICSNVYRFFCNTCLLKLWHKSSFWVFCSQIIFLLNFHQIWSHFTKHFASIATILHVKGPLQESLLAKFFHGFDIFLKPCCHQC